MTGAGGTLGAAAVRRLLGEGCAVLAVDRSAEALDALRESCGEQELSTCIADVSVREEVRRYADSAAERFGQVDYFFNNAGIEGVVARVQDIRPEDFLRVLTVNALGVLNGIAAMLPRMSSGGSIVNTGSTASFAGAAGMGAYVASKHAVLGLTRTAALEARGQGVRVNAVCPTGVRGPMMESIDAQRLKVLADEPGDSARYVSPDAVVDVVIYLMSEAARAVNGQAILVGKDSA
ncbi:SDR family oxidoreductase [Leucobacter weissii]|uniref:SDR family oxidoreductase n=1 Tax=Leucobacter weissii TaxID=1983706 RepID=A0A939S5K2_9MICO|nr:SDR family oxidoreductase [Leucobacter weissii]